MLTKGLRPNSNTKKAGANIAFQANGSLPASDLESYPPQHDQTTTTKPARSTEPTSCSKPTCGRSGPGEYPRPRQSSTPSSLGCRRPAGPRRGSPADPQMLACSNETHPFVQATIGTSNLTSAKRASDRY